ncbi:MAG: alpha/beta hydrolase [Varibaculum sp.]|nr:alpha/beta hydrolase [Varibaculum sp.]
MLRSRRSFHFTVGACALLLACGATLAGCGGPKYSSEVTNPLNTTGEAAPDTALKTYYEQDLTWEDCSISGAECAWVQVPLDYQKPTGETIQIRVARAAEEREYQGSLLINPGGPGASGVSFWDDAVQLVSDSVQKQFRLTTFDPRGVGQSAPVTCLTAAEQDKYRSTSFRDNPDGRKAAGEEQAGYGQKCLERSPAMTRHSDTGSAARDMDIIRAALGDEKLTYLGYSYGTFLGATYAELFPQRVGRMVLDGVLAPDYSFDQIAAQQAIGLQASLEHYIGYCHSQGVSCPLSGDKNAALREISDYLDGLIDEPQNTDDPDRPLTQQLAFSGLVLPLYYESSYPALTQALHDAFVKDSGAQLLRLADLMADRNPDGTYSSNANDAFAVINSLDYPVVGNELSWENAAKQLAKQAPLFGPKMSYGMQLQQSWPVPAVMKREPVRAAGAAPILIIGNLHDPATPFEMAKHLHGTLNSSVLVSWDSWNHTAYGSSSVCVNQAVDTYLLAGRTPVGDIACPA